MLIRRPGVVVLAVLAALLAAYLVVIRPAGAVRGIPRVTTPADNPLTDAKVVLGRWLFYDRRLSFNDSVSCGDCHQQQAGFADPRRLSVGATGEETRRNAMTLTNVAYNGRYMWANPAVKTLETQMLIPLLGDHPVEMGLHKDESGTLGRLRADARYGPLFIAAFPADDEPVRVVNAVKAISTFVRTLVSYNSPFDHSLAGDGDAISAAAQRGFALFRSDRLGCANCHDGLNFRMTPGHRTAASDDSVAYHNTGLYNLEGGAYPARDRGVFDVTGEPADMGRFKAPTLRNIAVTAPYMHDGSIGSLEAVLDHYARGGRLIPDGPDAGDGRLSPMKSRFITGFAISLQEKREVIAFLESLTDTAFLTDPRLANPFALP